MERPSFRIGWTSRCGQNSSVSAIYQAELRPQTNSLHFRYDLADDGADLSEFEQGVADFGIRKCEDVDQFNALLKDLGEDAYDIGYIPPEEETEGMDMRL